HRYVRPFSLVQPVGAAATQNADRKRLEIGVDVVDIKHDVLDLAERRHDVLGRGIYVLAAIDDYLLELILGHLLERVREAWGIRAAGTIRPVAAQAGFRVAAPTVVGRLVDLAVLDLVGLIAGVSLR